MVLRKFTSKNFGGGGETEKSREFFLEHMEVFLIFKKSFSTTASMCFLRVLFSSKLKNQPNEVLVVENDCCNLRKLLSI